MLQCILTKRRSHRTMFILSSFLSVSFTSYLLIHVYKITGITNYRDECFNKFRSRINNSTSILPPRLAADTNSPMDIVKCGKGRLLKPSNKILIGKVWMIFIIKSAPSHYLLRETIRRTWASVSEIEGRKLSMIFLLGKSYSQYEQDLMNEENEKFNDILQCDAIDSYHNITIKVLGSLQWLIEQSITATYYTLGDDDAVINLPVMVGYFKEYEKSGNNTIVCGFEISNEDDMPHRESEHKWRMSEELYDIGYKFPIFCHGAMYTMTKAMLQDIHCASKFTNFTKFFMDDVFISGILRYKTNGSNINIHKSIIDDQMVEIMHYPGGDGTSRYSLMEEKWNFYKSRLQPASYFKVGKKVLKVDPETVKFHNPLDNIMHQMKVKWHDEAALHFGT